MASPQISVFKNDPDFCSNCGSILLLSGDLREGATCSVCKLEIANEFDEIKYKIVFNELKKSLKTDVKKHNKKGGDDDLIGDQKDEEKPDGPVVDRECRECGYHQMSFATLQLRSADEGQTIFFTCLKCKFKETENS